jgi:hypothetical protein
MIIKEASMKFIEQPPLFTELTAEKSTQINGGFLPVYDKNSHVITLIGKDQLLYGKNP